MNKQSVMHGNFELYHFKLYLKEYWENRAGDSFSQAKPYCTYYAWPGAYPIFYLNLGNAITCHACANRLMDEYVRDVASAFFEWAIEGEASTSIDKYELPVARDVYYEGPELHCDDERSKDCCQFIPSAYGDYDK